MPTLALMERSPAVSPARARWLTALAVAYGALSTLRPMRESDLFWHLSLGRAVLRQGARTVPETLSFGSPRPDCVAPEWLWELLFYGAHRTGGELLASLLVLLCGALCGLALDAMLRRAAPDAHPLARLVALTVALPLALARVRERPEAAVMVLLPLTMGAVFAWERAPAASRGRALGALAGLLFLWVQTHASFVLGPALFAAWCLPALAPSLRERATQRDLAAAVLALALVSLTGSYGLGFARPIVEHTAGYAARHIEDLAPLSWEALAPSRGYGPLVLGGVFVGFAGSLVAGRLHASAFALAVLGALTGAAAGRGVALGGVLAAPWVLHGAHALVRTSPARRLWVGVAGACACLAMVALLRVHEHQGPLGSLGLAAGRHPRGAAAVLRALPRGSAVLTDFAAGAPLGFWLDGHVRVQIDARTPLYFDDTAFALARDLEQGPEALRRTTRRFDARAAVLSRRSGACESLAREPGWRAVLVDPLHVTFVRDGFAPSWPALRALSPCGEEYLGPAACAEPALPEELARLGGAVEPPFAAYLRAQAMASCGESVAWRALSVWLPARRDAYGFLGPRDRLAARALASTGRLSEAVELLRPQLERGELAALGALLPALYEPAHRALAREVLLTLSAVLDDRTPAGVRAALAAACAQADDVPCVRFHALRAALAGEPRAARLLAWLARHEREPSRRDDAARWLRALPAGAPEP